MKKGNSFKDSVVRIDSKLLLEVEEFIKKDVNKFRYLNKKHFIDLAVSEYLNNEKKRLSK